MHRRWPPQARARYGLHRVHRKCGNIVENGAIVGSGDCASLYFAASERNAAPFPNLGNHPRLASFLSLFPDCRLVAFHTIRRQPPCEPVARWSQPCKCCVVGTNPCVLRITREFARVCRDAPRGCGPHLGIPEYPGGAPAERGRVLLIRRVGQGTGKLRPIGVGLGTMRGSSSRTGP